VVGSGLWAVGGELWVVGCELWVVGCRMMMQVAGGELGAGSWEPGVGRCLLPSRRPGLAWPSCEWACETPTGNPAQTKSFALQVLRVLRVWEVWLDRSTVVGCRVSGVGCRVSDLGSQLSDVGCRAASVVAVRAATNRLVVRLSCPVVLLSRPGARSRAWFAPASGLAT
jgi:hypothetical protein